MKKIISLAFIGFFVFGTTSALAARTEEKKNPVKQILAVEGRGITNVVTSPCEVVRTFGSEIQLHSRFWPATYPLRFFLNFTTRVVSGINDVLVMPWIVNTSEDPRPITRHYDLPDYPWQKE